MKKSSGDLGAASPGESVVGFTATEGAHVEAVLFMEGGALGEGVRSLDVPVNTKRLVVGGGKAETRVAFCPGNLPVGKFGGSGRFEVEEYGMPSLRADEADSGGGRLAAA